MCANPQTLPTGDVVKCRTCNACLKARKADWIARAMAEKATSAETYTLTLTYAPNPDGSDPDGAKAFKYRDVQVWLNTLRIAAKRENPAMKTQIRYLIAGENGSKRKRVHWHVVLFANCRLDNLGTFENLAGKPEPLRMGRRQNWSLWPHGLVQFDPADQGGMAYVLKYILKDQFNIRRSKGTAREAKAETHGASFFRMSKKPPIGTDYVVQKIAGWREAGHLPVTTTIRIPEYKGYWWPTGKLRELMLNAMWAINAEHKHQTARNLPQWAALLSSVERLKQGQEGADYETLQFGVMDDGETTETIETISDELQQKRERAARIAAARARRTKCGGSAVCDGCYREKSIQERTALQRHRGEQKTLYQAAASPLTFESWYRQQQPHGNPHCHERGGADWFAAFPA